MTCLFCRIADGTEPASIIHQDEHLLAFMDIRAVRPGHALVIPRVHVDHFDDLSEELAGRAFTFAHRLAGRMRRVLKPRRVGMVIHGFGVPHAHLAVIPLEHSWDITSQQFAYIDNDRVKFRWENVPIADRAELDAHAARLRQALSE